MELSLELEAEFSTDADRDEAQKFLEKEGPTFADEVPQPYLFMWKRLQEELPPPQLTTAKDSSKLRVLFDVLPYDTEGYDDPQELAERIIECLLDVGAARVYAEYASDISAFFVVTKDGVQDAFNEENHPEFWAEVADTLDEDSDDDLGAMIVCYERRRKEPAVD
jgi:hypothetical protein